MANILVVDDESGIRELLRAALGTKGHQVTTVPSGLQAVDRVSHEPYDLVILDVYLDGESGLAALQAIRRAHPRLPLVVYSGNVTAELEQQSRVAGATEVLPKDLPILQLVERLEIILRSRDRLLPDPAVRQSHPVLIVDDDAGIRQTLRKFFELKGYRAVEAENGERALALFGQGKFLAVLLDLKMPVMDGLETLRRLKEIDPEAGIIMVSGNEDDEGVRKAFALGAYGYILKPFDLLYLELVVLSKIAIARAS